jgi:pyruvate,water dikinase
VLGIDRDSHLIAPLFDERDPAVMTMMLRAIEGARRCNRSISICGQAPSDYPELARKLIAAGISALSLNADAIIALRRALAE